MRKLPLSLDVSDPNVVGVAPLSFVGDGDDEVDAHLNSTLEQQGECAHCPQRPVLVLRAAGRLDAP